MKDYTTVFPDGIDDLNFFQDISIDKLYIMKQHQELISKGYYSSASEYLNERDVSFYGAWFFSMLEDRLIAIEEYIVNISGKPNLTTYGDTEPTGVEVGYCWT